MPFWEGMLAGYGIAIPVGAIAILIIDTGLRGGFKPGFMAGAGAATADLLYALVAALAGQLLMPWLAPVARPLGWVSGLVLVGIGGYGLRRALNAPKTGAVPNPSSQAERRIYFQFLGLTLLNPLTVAYFGSLILGGSGSNLITWADRLAFVIGAGLASLSWQTLLAGFGALGRRRLSTRWQTLLSVAGNMIVIGLGIRILVRLIF